MTALNLMARSPRRRSTVMIALAIAVTTLGAGVPAVAQGPTYTKDVAPIFRARCETCHRAGQMGPMPLTTYEEARPWARSIRVKVASRMMPPWHLDRTVGIQKYTNDISLTDTQVDTIVRWVDAGAPRGDLGDLPAAMCGRETMCGGSPMTTANPIWW